MASERLTPRDSLAGLPLPILPYEGSDFTSEHHHAHPRDSELLQDDGGIAIRVARIQRVDGLGGVATGYQIRRKDRNPGDHRLYHYYYGGPALPSTMHKQFEYLVWSTIPYIPSNAISFPNKKPKIVKMNSEQIKRLRETDIRVGASDLIGSFLGKYLIDQDLSHIDQSLIDEFVSTGERNRRRELGLMLLTEAAEVATDPLERRFKKAKELGRVGLSTAARLPVIVTQKLGGYKRQDELMRNLKLKLAS